MQEIALLQFLAKEIPRLKKNIKKEIPISFESFSKKAKFIFLRRVMNGSDSVRNYQIMRDFKSLTTMRVALL